TSRCEYIYTHFEWQPVILLKLFHSLDLKLKSCLIALFGSAFLAFGLYHVHSFSGVTEGGVLGMTLLLDHWFHISPSVSGFVMNLACYAMGWKLLGRQFIAYSILSSASFSLSYRICEQFPPLWPQLADMPLAASLLGAIFVGVGAGLCVRIGGAPGGDDALAMSLSHVTHIKIQWIYLLSDFAVLVLSLSYIPLNRMAYSILTVLLSGQIIGFVQTVGTHPVNNMET
ncbi:YitT family protein, partial [Clostridium sp. AF24-2LB]|uniref:YitT family protein n=1 Tax=Clostridium sp. AF24-2LB TaxID=2293007 RepID=UPI00325A6238